MIFNVHKYVYQYNTDEYTTHSYIFLTLQINQTLIYTHTLICLQAHAHTYTYTRTQNPPNQRYCNNNICFKFSLNPEGESLLCRSWLSSFQDFVPLYKTLLWPCVVLNSGMTRLF